MDLKKDGKEFLSIHEEFFELDKEKKLARIDLAFDSPSEIFNPAIRAGIPVISEEFFTSLHDAFDYIPDQYKLDISVSFSDPEGYDADRLTEIFRKNIMFMLRTLTQKTRRQNRLALILCGTGLVFTMLSIWLNLAWTNEGSARDIVFFILDIVTTVPFWGAMEIYLIDGSERRKMAANIRKRFNSISFRL